MTLPEACPGCGTIGTLERARVDYGGHVWIACSCCRRTFLLAPDGRVVHAGARQ